MSKSILPGYPGDAFFPRIILIFTGIWTFILFIQQTFKNFKLINSNESNNEENVYIYYKDIIFIFALSIIYIFFLDLIGFEILTFLFLFTLLVNRMDMNIKKSIIYSTIISFVSVILFWLIFIIFLKIPFSLKFLPFLLF